MPAFKASRSTSPRASWCFAGCVGRRRRPEIEKPFHPAYGFMKGLVRIMPGTDLTQPADPGWADRLDAEYGLEKREE